MSTEETIFRIGADPNSNHMEVCQLHGGFNFSIENPWAGDTETGFGYTTDMRLSAYDATQLRDWLSARLADKP